MNTERNASLARLDSETADQPAAQFLTRRFVERIAGRRRNRDVVNAIGTRLHDAFPLLTRLDRGLLEAAPARRIEMTIPLGNERFCYTLAVLAGDELAATASRVGSSGSLSPESLLLDAWLRALFADLSTYARTSVVMQEQLESLLY